MTSPVFRLSRSQIPHGTPVLNRPPESKSLDFLNGMRAVTALFVVAHHVYLHPPGVDAGHDIYHWEGMQKLVALLWIGRIRVAFFAVLSGFCLAIGPSKRDTIPVARDFLFRRARRILPPYFAALLLSLILIATVVGSKTGTHWDTSLPVTSRSLACRLLLVNAFGPGDGTINHVLWSIAVELHLYFCFLPLLFLAGRFGWRNTLLVVTPLSFLGAGIADKQLGTDASLSYLALFAFGMAAAHLTFAPHLVTLRARFTWPVLTMIAFTTSAVFALVPRWMGYRTPYYQLDFFVGMASVLLLVTLSLTPTSRLRHFLGQSLLVRVGGFSYSLYLVHAPLIQIIWQMGVNHIENPRVAFCVLLVSSLVLSLLGAYLFHLVFERPLMGRKPPAQLRFQFPQRTRWQNP